MPVEFYVDPKTGERKIRAKGFETGGFEEAAQPKQPLTQPSTLALGQTIEGITPPSAGAPTQRYEVTAGGVQRSYLPGEAQKEVYEPLAIPGDKQAKMAAPEKAAYEALRGIAGGSMLQTRMAKSFAPTPTHAEQTLAPEFKYSGYTYENAPTYQKYDIDRALQEAIKTNLPKYSERLSTFETPEQYLNFLQTVPQTAEEYKQAELNRILGTNKELRSQSELAELRRLATEERGRQGLTAAGAPEQFGYITQEEEEKAAELEAQRQALSEQLRSGLGLTEIAPQISREILTTEAAAPLTEQEAYLQNLQEQLATQKTALAGIEGPEAMIARAEATTGARRSAALAKLARLRDVGILDAYAQTQRKIADLESSITAAQDRGRFGEAQYLQGLQRDLQEEQGRIETSISPVVEQLQAELYGPEGELQRKQAEYMTARESFESGLGEIGRLEQQPGFEDLIAKERAIAESQYGGQLGTEYGKFAPAIETLKSSAENKAALDKLTQDISTVKSMQQQHQEYLSNVNAAAMTAAREARANPGIRSPNVRKWNEFTQRYIETPPAQEWIQPPQSYGQNFVDRLRGKTDPNNPEQMKALQIAEKYQNQINSANDFGVAMDRELQEPLRQQRQALVNQLGLTPERLSSSQGILGSYATKLGEQAAAAIPGKFTPEQIKQAYLQQVLRNIPDYQSLIG